MSLSAIDRFERWARATCEPGPQITFRRAFAAVWLVYDLGDLCLGGTLAYFKSAGEAVPFGLLTGSQLVLIASEAGMLFGGYPRLAALIACLARGFENTLYPLNDFWYFCITALLLSVADAVPEGPGAKCAAAWPRDVLVLQAAWIYFASAVLKLNPSFLSGGDLYVRQNYLAAAQGWPYPAFYRTWISALSFDCWLSRSGVLGELCLGLLLAAWWLCSRRRRWLRRLAIALAIGIHGFAAMALNVFFFGASLVAQVAILTREDRKPPQPKPL